MNAGQKIRFDGRVAIVTGGARGMGEAYSRALAERGCAVLVNDIKNAAETAASIGVTGGIASPCDVAVGTATDARAIVAEAIARFGRVDILINNAGVARTAGLVEATDTQIAMQFATNLLGPTELMRAAWPHMAEQGYGRILNISSIGAMGIGRSPIYAAAKAAMLGLTFDTALDGRQHGIFVNAAMPSAYTPMTEQIPDAALVDWYRRNLPAGQVANALLWFVAEQCDVSGIAVMTGGGRIARIGFADAAPIFDDDIAPEKMGTYMADILEPRGLRLLQSQREASSRYVELFPRS